MKKTIGHAFVQEIRINIMVDRRRNKVGVLVLLFVMISASFKTQIHLSLTEKYCLM